MRSFFSFITCLMFACSVYAHKDVTTFLGIPVDGSKAEMKRKLIAKGFTPTKQVGKDFLEGEFNGFDVYLYIVTNKNKVCRIMLADAHTQNEAGIRTRFNNLVKQFKKNRLNRFFLWQTNQTPKTNGRRKMVGLLHRATYSGKPSF